MWKQQLLLLTLAIPVLSREACLRDSVLESARLYLYENSSNGQTVNEPIRLVVYDWASADVATTLAQILIEEVLGYHVVQDSSKTVSIFDGVLKLAGQGSCDAHFLWLPNYKGSFFMGPIWGE